MLKFKKTSRLQDFKTGISSVLISSLLFFGIYSAYAATGVATLQVAVQSSLTFAVSNNTTFPNLTPGTAVFATTTLSMITNNAAGWNVSLEGDSQSPTDTVMDLSSDASVGITDQLEWINGAATTSAGNAVRIGSLDNTGDVLAFRVMTASSTNGVPFLASSWWGTTDVYTDSATTLWAGIASTTVKRQIGNAGTGSYSASEHLNTVLYYVDVGSSQQTGTYDGALTYTATAN